jgi:hypothetical protein
MPTTTGQVADLLSFRQIADVPFEAYMAALDSWQLTGHHGELRLGNSLPQGPIKRGHHFGICGIEVRLAREPQHPPVRTRLEFEPWSPTATVLELIPCHRVRPSAAYFLLCGLPPPAGLPDPPAPDVRAR